MLQQIIRLHFAALALLSNSFLAYGLEDLLWRAQWIGLPDAELAVPVDSPSRNSSPNTWCCFRKVFSLQERPERALTKIACDSKYWLWINGSLVVFEGQLKRGPTPQDTYFDVVDIAEYLRKGNNTVAVLVWHFGKDGMSHNDSGLLGFIFESDIDGKFLDSDQSWRVLQHPAYQVSQEPHPNWRLPESNIRFDARSGIGDWQSEDFNDSKWNYAQEYGVPPVEPWNSLVERPIPQWRISELLPYVSLQEEVDSAGAMTIIAKLPYNAQITPHLKVRAPAGKVLDIRTDNYEGGGEINVRAEYVTTNGEQEFESLGWMNGHEVHYTIPSGVEVLDLKYRESGYDTDFAGAFESDDPFLNRLWLKSQRTLYLEMRDGFVDCPGRERAQWWGDITLELQQTFYGLDTKSHDLTRKAMLELVNWRKPDGTIFSPVPAGNWDKELPMQMLASVGRYGFWTYYLHTGDKQTIKQVYPTVRDYVLEVWQLGSDGLVVQRQGGWTWGDWGENKDLPLLYNCWYYLALDGLVSMAELLGEADAAGQAKQRMASIEQNFNETYWQGTEYRSPDYKGETDDRGHALAVVSGLARPSQFDAIREVLKHNRHASPYMEKYVLQALFEMGFEADAHERMKQRYRKMVASELTTLWEGWGIGSEGYGGGSYNHAWSGGPLILLSKYAAGIAPLEPGYKSFQIKPVLGHLSSVSAEVASVAGEISVDVKKTDESLRLEFQVPKGTTGVVVIPSEYSHLVLAGQNQVWKSGAEGTFPTGLRFLRQSDQALFLTADDGNWTLTCKSVGE